MEKLTMKQMMNVLMVRHVRMVWVLLTTMLMWPLSLTHAQSHCVLLETTEGNITLLLYDDTPLHTDNFLRLVGEHFYDSLLFHRVIPNFMIQGGDPDSRHAAPGIELGEGDIGYTIAPEFFADETGKPGSSGEPGKPGNSSNTTRTLRHYHRRGVIAMAREGDDVNPERRSSGCQFYIVWGKTFSSQDLAKMQQRLDKMTNGEVVLTAEQIDTYRHVGGTPHLDGQYTVFGEVIGGLDVVDRIQHVFTDDYDRPVDDVRILRATVLK